MQMEYSHRSIIKRIVGICLWAGGFAVLQVFLEGTLDYLVFSVNHFSVAQMGQMTVFMRIATLVVYLFVLAMHSLFSDNSIDRIFAWMGDKEKRMLKSIIEEETEEEDDSATS